MSPFLAWGDFHERSRLARSTIPEEKWGTTRSLDHKVHNLAGKLPQEAGAKLPAIKQLTGFKQENMRQKQICYHVSMKQAV